MKAKSQVSVLNVVLETVGINGHQITYSIERIMQDYWVLSVMTKKKLVCWFVSLSLTLNLMTWQFFPEEFTNTDLGDA